MKKRKSPNGPATPKTSTDPIDPSTSNLPLGPTGRTIVVLRPESTQSRVKSLQSVFGKSVATSADFEDAAISETDVAGADAVVLENLDIAIVEGEPDEVQARMVSIADEKNPVLSVEPEMYAIPYSAWETMDEEEEPSTELLTPAGREYLRGYFDAISALGERMLAGGNNPAEADDATAAAFFSDTATLTWGLQAIKASSSSYTGSGIRIAVLDTGMDLNHPDFVGRSKISRSFVPGQAVQDGHSHGTHCIGTACGPKTPPGNTRRYGVATASTILIGKVLSNQGSGQQGWILAGINWAVQNKAAVISMSLGSPVGIGQGFSPAYEQAAVAALNNNCLIVAAAGNSGNSPVGSPANCPSVLAVGSVDQNLQRSSFSCIGLNPNGGEVNIAAPGRNVFSTVPMPARYGYKSGTSMATPHVAGVAALIAQATGARGRALWQELIRRALKIGQTPQTVGAGLAQAPVRRIIRQPIFKLPPFRSPLARESEGSLVPEETGTKIGI